MRFTSVPLVTAAALALALTGCAGSGSSGSQQASKDLVLGGPIAPATFEAKSARWANDSIFLQAVYDTLVRIEPNGTDVKPGLATEWEYNADKTVLTMKLRDGVTFTDGTKFTGDVAAKNLLRYRDGTGSLASLVADVADATAKDATTLEIKLKQPNPSLLVVLGQAPGLQESPAAFEKPDVKTNPVGSGPYILNTSQTVVGTSYKFDKNPNYWDAGSVKYQSLTVKVFGDSTSLLNALRGKQLDGASVGDNSIIDQVKGAGYSAATQELNFSGMILFDRAGKLNPALAKVGVRQAINYAIDGDAMLQAVDKGKGVSTKQVFREESPAYDKKLNERYPFDPAKAKQLLAEAGYPNGFELALPTAPTFPKQIWPLLQQQLADVGIKVSYTDAGTNYISDLLGQKYPAAYFTLRRDPSDWLNIKNLIAPNAVWNTFKYQDPKVDQLLATIQTSSGDAQAKALAELNDYVVEQAWFSPLYAPTLNFVTDSETSVVVNQGNAYPNLWNITPKA